MRKSDKKSILENKVLATDGIYFFRLHFNPQSTSQHPFVGNNGQLSHEVLHPYTFDLQWKISNNRPKNENGKAKRNEERKQGKTKRKQQFCMF